MLSEELKTVFDNMMDAICIIDNKGNIIFWNRANEILTGYKNTKVLGMPFENYYSFSKYDKDNSDKNDRINDMLLNTKHLSFESNCKHILGKTIDCLLTISPFILENGELYGKIIIARNLENEKKQIAEHQEFNKSLSQYVSYNAYANIYESLKNQEVNLPLKSRLTVAFIDIVNYTTLCENESDATIYKTLNIFYEKTSVIIRKYNGAIDKFIGDCAMCYFSKPTDCIKACKEIIGEGIFTINKKLQYSKMPEINLRIGVNSGELLQASIGGEFQKDFTLVGDVVNTASRIEQLALPRSILISENTYNTISNKKGFKLYTEVTLKGKSCAEKLYILTYNT
jgi:adenylate cyclase